MRVRLWDTKKQFKPQYGLIAARALTVWIRIACMPEWRSGLLHIGKSIYFIGSAVLCVVASLVFLCLVPVLLPTALIYHKMTRRRARYEYIIRNRAIDRDL